MQRMIVFLFVVGLVAACSGTPQESSPALESQAELPPRPTVAPTVEAPTFRQPVARITTENANRITYLARLDPQTRQQSTIFDHTFSPDGTRLAALNNSSLMAWDVTDGRPIFTVTRRDAIHVYYSPDKTEMYTVDPAGLIAIYEAERGTVENTLQSQEGANGVSAYYDFDGWLAIGGDAGQVQVWNPFERVSEVALRVGEAEIVALAFSDDGALLAVSDADNVVTVWDWRERAQVATFDHRDTIATRLVFSPDNAQLATGTQRYIAVWSTQEENDAEALQYTLQIERGGAGSVLQYSQDGRFLISAGADADMFVIAPEEGDIIAQLPEVSGDRLSAEMSPDGDLMITTVLGRGVSLWNLAASTDETVPRATLDLGTRRIVDAEWSEDGFLIAFFDAAGSIYLWGIPEAA